ncbi:MAG: hypothetical protein JSW08_01375 [archaeon]|nr:MAG: hypothetical protein JSW08_01375 [archaeon]
MAKVMFYSPDEYEYLQLVDFFRRTDRDYSPPTSQIMGGIEEYLHHWILQEGEATIAKTREGIIGSFGWWNVGDLYWADWIGVLERFRGEGLHIELIKHALTKRPRTVNGIAYNRTCQGNSKTPKLMEGLGAERINPEQIPNPIMKTVPPIQGRESLWYKLQLSKAHERLGIQSQ